MPTSTADWMVSTVVVGLEEWVPSFAESRSIVRDTFFNGETRIVSAARLDLDHKRRLSASRSPGHFSTESCSNKEGRCRRRMA